MNDQIILEDLLVLLEANGVKIRSEPLGGGGGGLCTIKGEHIFFLDTQSPSSEMAIICAEAVGKVVDIESIYIKPQIREFIENHKNETV
ncbi:MAG: hypothetical protein ACYSWP_08625 [Planctomycetota bacterium]|jgi:hypothetical protein